MFIIHLLACETVYFIGPMKYLESFAFWLNAKQQQWAIATGSRFFSSYGTNNYLLTAIYSIIIVSLTIGRVREQFFLPVDCVVW